MYWYVHEFTCSIHVHCRFLVVVVLFFYLWCAGCCGTSTCTCYWLRSFVVEGTQGDYFVVVKMKLISFEPQLLKKVLGI